MTPPPSRARSGAAGMVPWHRRRCWSWCSWRCATRTSCAGRSARRTPRTPPRKPCLALQTQQFNEMNSVLYACAVEEYRIRTLLYGLELTAYGNGGCSTDSSCATRYSALYTAYLKAAARYRERGRAAQPHHREHGRDHDEERRRARSSRQLANPSVCGQTGGGDCAFSYALLDFSPRTPVYTVVKDARAFITPSYGDYMNDAPSASTNR